MQSALDFDETTVEDILTPRVDVIGAEETDSNEEIEKLFFQYGYSRLPIYRDSIDDIIGILYFKDFFRAYRGRANVDIHSLMQQPLFVPPTKRISELLREIQHTKKHLVVVTDQYGGTLGIVTLEDMLEELIDRFGDPPTAVMNLLEITLLRGLAHSLYITEVKARPDMITFTMYEKQNPGG